LDLLFSRIVKRLEWKAAWATEEADSVKGIFDGRDTMLHRKGLVEWDEVMLELFSFLPLLREG